MNNNLICARIVIDITADLIKTTWTYKLPDLLKIFQQYIYFSVYISPRLSSAGIEMVPTFLLLTFNYEKHDASMALGV